MGQKSCFDRWRGLATGRRKMFLSNDFGAGRNFARGETIVQKFGTLQPMAPGRKHGWTSHPWHPTQILNPDP